MIMNSIAMIRKNSTGEIREYDGFIRPDEDVYIWEEGNFACDCNRELFFFYSKNEEPEREYCSGDRFSVNLKDAKTGDIFYSEY